MEIDWMGENNRVSADFPLDIDNGGETYYEVPYGIVKRPDTIESTNQLGIEDEWPALNWFAVHDAAADCSVVVFNRGTPGCRVKDGHMQLSLLRSPTVLEFANEGARDHGRHVFEYAVTSCAGLPENCDPVSFGLRYNTVTPSAVVESKYAELPGTYSFISGTEANVNIAAIKRDADGNMILRAADAYGNGGTLLLPYAAAEVDPLEVNTLSEPNDVHVFEPFETQDIEYQALRAVIKFPAAWAAAGGCTTARCRLRSALRAISL